MSCHVLNYIDVCHRFPTRAKGYKDKHPIYLDMGPKERSFILAMIEKRRQSETKEPMSLLSCVGQTRYQNHLHPFQARWSFTSPLYRLQSFYLYYKTTLRRPCHASEPPRLVGVDLPLQVSKLLLAKQTSQASKHYTL